MKTTTKYYQCIEDGELFLIRATGLTDARNQARVWGAEVIGEYNRNTGVTTPQIL
jgi:hypothetical protein